MNIDENIGILENNRQDEMKINNLIENIDK
jgi:hypothetical protein